MRFLMPLTLLTLSCTASVNAEQSESKQWFNSINYAKIDSDYYSDDVYGLSTHYYFEKQQNPGVWDDFGYLDTDSNIGLNYFNSDGYSGKGIFGEGFYGNAFATFELPNIGDADNYSLGLGYLFADSLKVSVRMLDYEYSDTVYLFKAQYNHEINDTDYIGFTVETDDETESWDLSSRYFAHLYDDSYFAVNVDYLDVGDDSVFNVLANYYFNKHVAVGIGSNDSDLVIEGKYFINDSYYFTANYTDNDNYDIYNLSFVAQF
ncbi:putative porin [Pseudoalteromonas sp. APC 3691]|uniref:putative porin n=1 Tax=Pseudoalteromonas sp. APC 3691 TaxID=3035173 RepID=UPI0025B2925E|nr:putative porin [Pseudoalteromonas sp. APC 3691]MDN3392696.1 putative porin [Pseudoalteromonas sp. APC 3691]